MNTRIYIQTYWRFFLARASVTVFMFANMVCLGLMIMIVEYYFFDDDCVGLGFCFWFDLTLFPFFIFLICDFG